MIGKTILLIDDDTDFLFLTSQIFQKAGAHVETAVFEIEGIRKFIIHHPDLIILDVTFPDANGFDICRKIRLISEVPIIILTALNKDHDMLEGLDAGADDFLSKPFNADMLLARSKAVLRRREYQNDKPTTFKYNDGYLNIDAENYSVLIRGVRIKLSRVEFHILVYLARNAGKVLTINQILSAVWGDEYWGNTEYVHIYISRLRRKLEENTKSPRYFITVHGVGYVFESQEFRGKK
jgi:DNA-binding response OmpR family regulator